MKEDCVVQEGQTQRGLHLRNSSDCSGVRAVGCVISDRIEVVRLFVPSIPKSLAEQVCCGPSSPPRSISCPQYQKVYQTNSSCLLQHLPLNHSNTMTSLAEDELTRASTQGLINHHTSTYRTDTFTAAEQFVDGYYNALSNNRPTISSYIMPMTSLPTGRILPTITYNGLQLSDPHMFQTAYVDQMPFTHFEVQSFNVHVLNPSIEPIEAKGRGKVKEMESNMSLVVQVSGYVRLVERKEGPMRGFSDSLVLVPNKEAAGAKGKAKSGEGRSWLVQSQNFRFVV